MINEALVRSFLTLARTGNMTETARRLYMSQQGVSKHLARLEEDLGCALFSRERGSMVLTEQGEVYLKAFSQIEEILSAARDKTERMRSEEDNRLVIGHLELLNVYRVFKPIYQDFAAANPDVRLIYKSTSEWAIENQLLEGRVDVVFNFRQDLPSDERMEYIVVKELREMLVAAADHPLAATAKSYLDFREEPVFYTPNQGSGLSQEERMAWMGFPTDRLVETDGILSSCSAVEMRQGVTFMAEYCRLLDSDCFRTYPTDQQSTLVMAYLRDGKKPALRRFTQFMEERLKK